MINQILRMLATTLLLCCAAVAAHAETPDEWITLGTRIHGAFGVFIPVGIRIGLDALQRLNAEPRGVTVVYYSGPKAPCPCPVDGIAIAVTASPGQGTLQVAPEKAREDLMGVAVIRSKATGAGVMYSIAAAWIPKLLDMNKTLDPRGRYDAVMNAVDLFTAEALPPPAAQR